MAQTNYVPVIGTLPVSSAPFQGIVLGGTAVPTLDPGTTAALYARQGTGDIYYWKESNNSWNLFSGGTAIGGSVLAGDYSGVAPAATPTGPAIAKDTVTGQVWFYDGTGWA